MVLAAVVMVVVVVVVVVFDGIVIKFECIDLMWAPDANTEQRSKKKIDLCSITR